jgi:transposase-like protein
MRGEVLGAERRRRWSDDAKLEIVSSVGIDGATVTQVAQRNEVTRQQIYAWRHELKKKGLWSAEAGAIFLPIEPDRVYWRRWSSSLSGYLSRELCVVKVPFCGCG